MPGRKRALRAYSRPIIQTATRHRLNRDPEIAEAAQRNDARPGSSRLCLVCPSGKEPSARRFASTAQAPQIQPFLRADAIGKIVAHRSRAGLGLYSGQQSCFELCVRSAGRVGGSGDRDRNRGGGGNQHGLLEPVREQQHHLHRPALVRHHQLGRQHHGHKCLGQLGPARDQRRHVFGLRL